MRSKSFDGMVCSIAEALDAVGDRWAVLILRDLFLGLSRYEDLRRSSGITNATLSDRLKHLEGSGLIERQKYQEGPKRFKYVLTGKGADAILLIQALVQLGDKWTASSADGPPLTFTNRKTGARVKLAFIDERSGERVKVRDMVPKAGPGADDLVQWRLSHMSL